MGVEHRAHGRHFEVADIGMPAAAKIAQLVFFLAHLDDLGVAVHAVDEIVDLQFAEAAAEGNVLLRGQLLLAKENDAIVDERPADFADHVVVEVARQVDAGNFGAERP